MKKRLALYSILIGAAMVGSWSVLYALDAVPELVTKPWEIAMHLAAEFATAVLLIISGLGILARARWAMRVNTFASGMLVYTLIQSPGYYLERNVIAFAAICAACLVLTLVLSPVFRADAGSPRA